ncbi:MAG: hypothetical protein LBL33_05000 [Tannerella sp.]|jgi:hypothetical protein|nr:hypothetical protein [Tannerella sp.]
MDTIEKDVYVAYHGNSAAYIAMDEYDISRISTGFLIKSNNTVFGSNGFHQKAVLQTDFHWQMQELKVDVESLNIEMLASINHGKLYLQQKQANENFEKIIDLQHEKHFFLYSGALVIPMIWMRGFDFDNYEKVTYQMLPMGYAEVKQLCDPDSGQGIRHFSIMIYLQSFVDIIKAQTDMFGKLLYYYSETNQITIKIQS